MYRIGVDIGGTFTDFVLLQDATGAVNLHKQLTTPEDPSLAVIEGIERLLGNTGVGIGEVSRIVHGTTLVTNALIERRGARTGMLVTEGMRDVLDIARERRYDLFDLRLQFPSPMVPRSHRREIAERIRTDGKVSTALDLDQVRAATDDLIAACDIEAIAVCFLNSYANPAHEQLVLDLLASEYPQLRVSGSADVFPYVREYERWTTTTMNAYVQPVVDRYIARIEAQLQQGGFDGRFYIMTSSGGMVTAATARRYPIRLLESGPAAGALMSAQVGAEIGAGRLLSFDMGGTTAKGALVRDGKPLKKYELEVARVHEFKAGSGLPAKAPVIDMIEIGAGGGSIASIDDRGVIRVGPKSAGARPGPACYGRGGDNATLTDANLILGYLDADRFLGGRMKLDRSAAERAITARIGTPLDLDLVRAAWGIHETVNEDVANAFRVHASERAFDYRQSSMVGFGGGGPLHATRIARKLNVPRLILPPGAGVMSAFGLLISPFSFEMARSHRMALQDVGAAEYAENFGPMISELRHILQSSGTADDQIVLSRKLDIRYEGQGYEIEVTGTDSPAGLSDRFAAAYNQVFSSILLDEPLEIVNWKVEGSGPPPLGDIRFSFVGSYGSAGPHISGHRKAYFPEAGGMIEVPVYDRYTLMPGATFSGPAVVEEQESTLVVGSGDVVSVDAAMNLIVNIHSAGAAS